MLAPSPPSQCQLCSVMAICLREARAVFVISQDMTGTCEATRHFTATASSIAAATLAITASVSITETASLHNISPIAALF